MKLKLARSKAPADLPTNQLDFSIDTTSLEVAPPELAGAPATPKTKRATGGWLRVVKGNRALTIIGGIALLSLGFGLGASNLVTGPAGATLEEAPEAGLITVPVERGELNNDVTIRGDIGFVDAADVTINTASFQGPAIVTGAIPQAGDELGPLSVALEILGRPVIVLPGELPAYRTLTVGMSGPDVVQFKEAMRAVGIDAGDPSNNVFDNRAAEAVRTLYARVGYPVPGSDDSELMTVADAERGITLAERAVRDARATAEDARWGGLVALAASCQPNLASASGSWLVEMGWGNRDHVINSCVDAWEAQNPRPERYDGQSDDEYNNIVESWNASRAARADQVARDFDGSINASVPVHAQEAVADAELALTQAREALTRAQTGNLPSLPLSEVLFMTNLPRRVDSVSINRGDTLTGVSFRVSGAQLQLRGSATEANARLLEEGGEAFFDLPGGGTHRAVIDSITAPTDGGSRWNIEFTPDPLTPEQFAMLQGSNVRVQIPVGATQGAVLYVPVAALTAGPGGEARLQVVDGDPRDGARANTRLVTVETGLSANGFVEVTPVGGATLAEGDLVVVGQ